MNKDLMLEKWDKVTYYDIDIYDEDWTIIGDYNEETIAEFEECGNKVTKVERPIYKTIYEVRDVLNAGERKWLKNFIEPYKDRIKKIKKISISNNGKEFICIYIKNGENIKLPTFKKGTMYKEMKLNKEYTLEELDLL